MPADSTRPTNRTGVAAALHRAAQMITAVEEFPPTSEGNGRAIAAVRVQYAQEGADEGAENHPAVVEETPLLMDKLGERLAFERSGTRLYEALSKPGLGSLKVDPPRRIRSHLERRAGAFPMLEIHQVSRGDPRAHPRPTCTDGIARVRQVLGIPGHNLVSRSKPSDGELATTSAGRRSLAWLVDGMRTGRAV